VEEKRQREKRVKGRKEETMEGIEKQRGFYTKGKRRRGALYDQAGLNLTRQRTGNDSITQCYVLEQCMPFSASSDADFPRRYTLRLVGFHVTVSYYLINSWLHEGTFLPECALTQPQRLLT
jgi:hypothetical protein